MFTCEGCGAAYEPVEATSVARLYVKDSRCNHIEARCSCCGVTEVIYLGPNRIQEVLRVTPLPVSVFAEATARLRVRAENAWAAAEADAEVEVELGLRGEPANGGPEGQPPHGSQPHPDAGTTVTEAPKSYELTPRQEKLLASFGDTLTNIPDELLWDGIQSDHRGDLPPRWID